MRPAALGAKTVTRKRSRSKFQSQRPSRMSDIDVVFLAPDAVSGHGVRSLRRTIAFSPGQPVPRIGECVIIGFEDEPARWLVEDVAHIFDRDAHGIAIKLTAPEGL